MTSSTVRRTAEVRLTDPDLLEVIDRVAMSISAGLPIELIFAAEGSAYPVLWVPNVSMAQAWPDGYGPGARTGSGGDPSYVYTVRDAHHRQAGRWLAPTFHDLRMVTERYVDNVVDALPFWALLNLVEIARGFQILSTPEATGASERARLLDLLRQGYDDVGAGPRFTENLPEAFDR